MLNAVTGLGAFTTKAVASLGDYSRFTASIFHWMFRGPGRFARKQLWRQMFEIGTMSIPVVAVTGGFIGMVLAIEAHPQFKAIGLEGRLGSVINISVVKQIGPVLTGVMLAGRVGGALTAELGTMKVTEQLDALRAMASDPVRTLVVPRFMACILMMPILTIFSDAVGIFGGYAMCIYALGVSPDEYIRNQSVGLDIFNISSGLIKSVAFGATIASIACWKGFRSENGAQGVGKACTEAFVTSFIVILVANFFLAMLLNFIHDNFWTSVNILATVGVVPDLLRGLAGS
jgi:phospholipid/cholesterol/gamma-HCH transport system permease protein